MTTQEALVSSDRVTQWVSDWGPLITLSSTVILLLVTGWLAYLTKVMANSARDSTEHAKTAAQASLASVAASEASVDVDFDVTEVRSLVVSELRTLLEDTVEQAGDDATILGTQFDEISVWRAVQVRSKGATVYVHGCRLDFISHRESATGGAMITKGESCSIDLLAVDPLPQRRHKDEQIDFSIMDRASGIVQCHRLLLICRN